MAIRSVVSMEPVPNLVLEQSAGELRLQPERRRGSSGFAEQMSQRDRRIDVGQHHGSFRASSRSAKIFSNVRPGTGLPFGGQSGPRTAGLIQPSRMPRSMTDSGFGRGGLISATTRPRSVMTTVARRRGADVLAELVLQGLQADDLHAGQGGFQRPLCQSTRGE